MVIIIILFSGLTALQKVPLKPEVSGKKARTGFGKSLYALAGERMQEDIKSEATPKRRKSANLTTGGVLGVVNVFEA